MNISGERGKEGNGFSLKDPNKTGTYTVYIWNKNSYDAEFVKRKRDEREKMGKVRKNYSRVDGWKKIGVYGIDHDEYINEILKHLEANYDVLYTYEEVEERMKEKYEELERKRIDKLNKIKKEIILLCDMKGIAAPNPPSIKSAIYHLNKIKKLDSVQLKRRN